MPVINTSPMSCTQSTTVYRHTCISTGLRSLDQYKSTLRPKNSLCRQENTKYVTRNSCQAQFQENQKKKKITPCLVCSQPAAKPMQELVTVVLALQARKAQVPKILPWRDGLSIDQLQEASCPITTGDGRTSFAHSRPSF